MIGTLGLRIATVFRHVAPDPFVLAVLLTAAVFALAKWQTDATFVELVDAWADPTRGVWSLLGFSMQMCLILVTGHAVAASRPVSAVLGAMASAPRTPWQAVAMVAFVAGALGVVNWGLGLIGGAILAREVGRAMERRGVATHYPLLAAAGYVGLLVWHGGFSGSAPITITTDAQIQRTFGVDAELAPTPLTETLLSPLNLVTTGGLLILAPVVLATLCPRASECEPASASIPAPPEASSEAGRKPFVPRLLEDTPIVNWLLAALLAMWAWRYYLPSDSGSSGALSLTPNSVNLTMLLLALVLHASPRSFLDAAAEGTRGCVGILLQFPLYAGIKGVMDASGLTTIMIGWLTEGATASGLPIRSFLSAAVVNLFIPSGGGQWGVQGPVLMEAGRELGVSPTKTVMSFAYGDQLTNMLQPFWALPLLAVTGCKAREIVGYTAILMLAAAAWITLCLLVL